MGIIKKLFYNTLSSLLKVLVIIIIAAVIIVIQIQRHNILNSSSKETEDIKVDDEEVSYNVDEKEIRDLADKQMEMHLESVNKFLITKYSSEQDSDAEKDIEEAEEEVKKPIEAVKEPETKPVRRVIEVNNMLMGDEYPSACEAFSTTMLLNYWNYKYSIDRVLENLPTSQLKHENGELVGDSPNNTFIGDPRNDYAFCCYEPVIQRLLGKLTEGDMNVVNTTGNSLSELCSNYIDNDEPVVIWATIDMKQSYPSTTWRIEGTDKYYTWPGEEHCMLLVGYDDSCFYFNDPYNGCLMKWDKSVSEARYKEIGMQSVTITR